MSQRASARNSYLQCNISRGILDTSPYQSERHRNRSQPRLFLLRGIRMIDVERCAKKDGMRVMCFKTPFQQCLMCGLICFGALLPVQLFASDGATTAVPADDRDGAPRASAEHIVSIVEELKKDLSIPDVVEVAIVPVNKLIVSVERVNDRKDVFLLSLQADFLSGLSPAELEAVIAHELGHVWIFTHHPYLQTEELANQVAMRVVSRASLESVYARVWARTGAKGDLAYLPPPPRPTATPTPTPKP